MCVDSDDPQVDAYKALSLPPWVRVRVGERLRLGPTLNLYAVKALLLRRVPSVIGFMGDDHRPRTPGWDSTIAAVAEKCTAVIYGNDRVQGKNLPTAVALTTDIVSSLGYMVPPGAIHLYLDDFWKYLGTQLGRLKYLPGVVIEHVHPITGKVQWDDVYREANAPQVYEHDYRVFDEWTKIAGPAAIEKLKAVMT